jgi:cytochrome b6-f complex iron-sulfur subunit
MSVIMDFIKSLAGICRTKPLEPRYWETDGSSVTVRLDDITELGQPGDAVYLTGRDLQVPILIVRTHDEGFVCVENRCTHMGRKLDPQADGRTLRCCSVSHSKFDYSGNKLSGPAKGPVKVYSSQVNNGKLVIQLN